MQEILDRLAAGDNGAQIANRLLLPYLNHAATMFESGYATRDDIDASMRFGCGYPVGPLALIDAIGPDAVATRLTELFGQTGDELHRPVSYLTNPHSADGSDPTDSAPQLRHSIKRVGVVGTGTMASGIGQVFAQAGYDVTYVGRSEEKVTGVLTGIAKSLDKAIVRGKLDEGGKADVLGRLTGTISQEALADADIIIEAIAEDLSIKLELFKNLDRIAKPGAILATTTSSLSIDTCAGVTGRPQHVIGMHFFNPAPIMKLVEVVSGTETSVDVAETVHALCLSIKKHPVSCSDRAGFIVNALLFPYLNDAIKLNAAGAGTLEEIDAAMKEINFPMGPFQLLDVVGNDVSLAIQQSLVEAFGHEGWEPAELLLKIVAEGKLGRKTGEGFHSYNA